MLLDHPWGLVGSWPFRVIYLVIAPIYGSSTYIEGGSHYVLVFLWAIDIFSWFYSSKIFIDFFAIRFLFDERCSDYKYYEYRLSEEEKALSQTRDSQTSQGGQCIDIQSSVANFSLKFLSGNIILQTIRICWCIVLGV